MYNINLSVRALAEYAFRSGHLDNTYMSNSRALDGIEIHKRLQDMEGASYEKEYFLKKEIEYKGMMYVLEGRADGIYREDTLFFVDEIERYNIVNLKYRKIYIFSLYSFNGPQSQPCATGTLQFCSSGS